LIGDLEKKDERPINWAIFEMAALREETEMNVGLGRIGDQYGRREASGQVFPPKLRMMKNPDIISGPESIHEHDCDRSGLLGFPYLFAKPVSFCIIGPSKV